MSTPLGLSEPTSTLEPPSFGGYAGGPGGLIGVSFWPRVGARLIDFVVHYIVAICAAFLFGIVLAVAAAAAQVPVQPLLAKLRVGPTSILFGLLGAMVYEVVCEAGHGSTLGKLALGMVVLQEDGTPCRFKPALIRSAAYFIDALFFGIVGYFCMQKSPQEQRHGDEWAHTVVCKRAATPPDQLRSGQRFAAVFLLAMAADAACQLTALTYLAIS